MNYNDLEKNKPEEIDDYSRVANLIRRLEKDNPKIFNDLDSAMNMKGKPSLQGLADHIESHGEDSGYDSEDIKKLSENINSLIFEKDTDQIKLAINKILAI